MLQLSYLKSYGGNKDDVASRETLSELSRHELAVQYYWTGENSSKTPARNLLLLGLVEKLWKV